MKNDFTVGAVRATDHGPRDTPLAALSAWLAARAARNRARRDYARLRALDPHLLRDAGLTLADLDAADRRP